MLMRVENEKARKFLEFIKKLKKSPESFRVTKALAGSLKKFMPNPPETPINVIFLENSFLVKWQTRGGISTIVNRIR